ncbi:hypothetical protein CHU98_g12130, partial [Xylaria longipes]
FRRQPDTMRELAVPVAEVFSLPGSTAELSGADVLKAGYQSPSGWVGVGDALACPVRIRRLDTSLMARRLADLSDLLVPRSEWINIGADTRISQAARWIKDLLMAPAYGEAVCGEDSILAVVDAKGEVIGVLEAGELMRWRESWRLMLEAKALAT